jgi:T5SS/PEP-CTERM-associated repeat protein
VGYGQGSDGYLYINDVNYQDLNPSNGSSFSLADGNDSYAYMQVHNVGDFNVDGDLILAKGDDSSAELYIYNDIYDVNHPAPQINLNGGNLYLGFGEDSDAGTFSWSSSCCAEPYGFNGGLELHDGMSTTNVNDVFVGYGVDSYGVLYEADPNSQLNYDGMLYVGYGGRGAVNLNYANLGTPKDMNVILGYGEGSWGALNIEDANWQDLTFSSDPNGDFILGNGDYSRGFLDITDVNKFTVARDLVLALGDYSTAMIDFDDSCPYDTKGAYVDVGRNMYLGLGDDSEAGCFDYWGSLPCGGSYPVLDCPLEIHDHMVLDVNNNLFLGYGDSSVGYMTVDESSRLYYGDTLYVGYGGYGQLDIDYGWLGSAMDMNVVIAYGDNSFGYLNITDANWQDFTFNSNPGDLILGNGDYSIGFLGITDVNRLDVAGDLVLAHGDGSVGMMWFNDSNTYDTQATHLNVGGSLYLGYGDYSYAGCADDCPCYYCVDWNNPLEIHDYMVADVNNNVYIAHGYGSWGYMTVDSTSELNYGGMMYVGYGGHGRLDINYGYATAPIDMNAVVAYGDDSCGILYINDANTLNLSSNPGDFFMAVGEDSWAQMYIDDVNNVNVDGTLYAAYGDYSTVRGCDSSYYDCVEDTGLGIYDFNTISIGDDLILAYGDESDAWMSLWSDDFNSPQVDVGDTIYLGYGEGSRAGLYIGDGIYVGVNQDVVVDYGPDCTSPCYEADSYTACYDWEDLCDDDDFSVSVLMVEPNATLDVGGNLWVGYGTYSVGGVALEEAVLDVNDDIILGFQPHSYGALYVDDSDLTFGRMFVGYGGHGTLEIEEVNTVNLDENVAFFGYGPDSSASVYIEDVNRINVTGSWNLGYGQDSVAIAEIEEVNDVNVTGNLNLAYGEDSWGAAELSYINDVNIAGNLNLAYGQGSDVAKVCLIDVNNMQIGGSLSLAYGSSSTFGTLSVLDSTLYIGDSLYMGYGGTADELIINRSFIGVGTDPCALDEGLSIASDGYLGGAGTIWGDVYNQGTISPGNSTGTLKVVGDLTFEPNSVYAVDIANKNSSDDTTDPNSIQSSDKVVVTGDLNINGGTIEVTPVETITQSREYTIAEAGSVNNSATDGWDSNDVVVVAPSVLLDVEDPNLTVGGTYVSLTVNAIGFNEPNIIETHSQDELGDALQQIANEDGGNDVTTGLQQIESKSELLKAYNQLSNQSRPPMDPITIDASMRFLGVVGEHLRGFRPIAGRSGYRRNEPLFAMNGPVSQITGTTMMDVNPYGAVAVGNGSPLLSDQRWGIWAKGYGVFGDRESDSGITGHDYRITGLGFGLDYMFSDDLLAGVTLGYSDGDVDYDDLRDSTDVQSTHIGAYASYKQETWYCDAIFSYSQNEYDSVRYVDFLSERLTGSYDGHSFSGYLEVGMDWRETEISLLQPLVGLQIGHISIDSYRESGGDSAVGVGKSDYDSIKSSLGIKYTHMFTTLGGRFDGSARLHARWLHEFADDNSSVDAYFTSNPDAVFTIEDAEVSRDSALLGGRLSIDIGEQARAAIQYDVSLNSIETTQFIGGFLLYRW